MRSCDELLTNTRLLLRDGEYSWEEQYFLQAAAHLREELKHEHECFHCRYYLGLVHARLFSYRLHTAKDTEGAKRSLDDSLQQCERSISLNAEFSDSRALFGYTLGIRGGMQGIRGYMTGARSKGEFDKAVQLDPYNPTTFLLRGISLYNTPKFLGGSFSRAYRDLAYAVQLFEREEAERVESSWGYEEVWLWLARCQVKMGNHQAALDILREGHVRFPTHVRLARNLQQFESVDATVSDSERSGR